MARVSVIAKERKKEAIVSKYRDVRDALRRQRSDINLTDVERLEAQVALQKLPVNSSPSRLRNRCQVTGRPRGVFRRFKLSRTKVREHAMDGDLPGVRKASW